MLFQGQKIIPLPPSIAIKAATQKVKNRILNY